MFFIVHASCTTEKGEPKAKSVTCLYVMLQKRKEGDVEPNFAQYY